MDQFADEELVALKQFRCRIVDLISAMTPYQSHDVSLLRFLRARDLDIEKAITMIRKNWDWRINNNIDNLLQVKLPAQIETMFPVKVCGFSKDGFPVLLAHCGVWDFVGAFEAGLREDFVTYVEQFFEQAVKFCEVYSTPDKFLTQAYVIIDASGFTLRQLTSKEAFQVVVQLIRIFESNYPELLRLCFVINVPTIFSVVWKAVKRLLATRTASKIFLLGGSNEWQPIFDLVDPDNWPSEYGGAITTCIDYRLSYGFDVFPKYTILPDQDLQSIVVGAGQKVTVPVTVESESEGWTLSWNFRTMANSGDIGFGVDLDSKNGGGGSTELKQLVKNVRVNSHLHLQKGIISCEESGQYILTFDNSYSTFRAKTVDYAVRLEKNPQRKRSASSISAIINDNDEKYI